MKKAVLYTLFAVCALVFFQSVAFAAESCATVLYEPESGSFLFEENASTPLPMASTTKIMTALVALETAPLDTVLRVPREAVGTEGTSLYLKEGDTGTLSDFLYALMLNSANDAAVTIAVNLYGSVEAFADAMNTRADALTLTNTHFVNPHGLPDMAHYTSARDLAVITAEAMLNPDFCRIVSTKEKTIYLNGGETVRHLHNHNRLLSSHPDAVGVKTGFTKAAGRCLVSAARRDGVTVIAVTLNCPDDWQKHTVLLNDGLLSFECVTLAKAKDIAFTLPVIGGRSTEVLAYNPSAITCVLPKGADVSVSVETTRMPAAPIKKGTPIGRIVFTLDGRTVAEAPLVAAKDVQKLTVKRHLFPFFK